jgi:hypothetical protein
MIGQNKKLAQRVCSLVEMNCEFQIFEDNIVLLKNVLGDIYPLPKDDKKLNINLSRQLLSVCSCLTEKPFIQI